MEKYKKLNLCEKESMLVQATSDYDRYKEMKLSLDMSRGKPGSQQLDLSMDLMKMVNEVGDVFTANGVDCRNYGLLDGIPEAQELFGSLMQVPAKNVIVGGNSSLNMMYDSVCRGFTHGYDGCDPWHTVKNRKFICPSPGYDRHFGITESFGFDMITVPMTSSGPDMNMVEKLIGEDESIKGIWCVPKYSNPDGYTYSDETVIRFSKLKPKAKDFKIFWDNAYCIHDIDDQSDVLMNIYDLCEKEGTSDNLLIFCSTSKITFPGSGVAAMGASDNTINRVREIMTTQTIGSDKMNQLAHVRYLKNLAGCKEYMKKHAKIIYPRFSAVFEAFDNELMPMEFGSYIRPRGGYFVSYYAPKGCAKRIVELCKEAGVILTGAGATYPYGIDPDDSNIRIAPTYPSVEDLKSAMEVFCVAVKIAALEKEI